LDVKSLAPVDGERKWQIPMTRNELDLKVLISPRKSSRLRTVPHDAMSFAEGTSKNFQQPVSSTGLCSGKKRADGSLNIFSRKLRKRLSLSGLREKFKKIQAQLGRSQCNF
jgi:hypothetical protein